MKNLIIIPAYNEAENIENTVRDVIENAPSFDYLVVNDCSLDNTLDICRKNHFNYLNLPLNLGIGGAVQSGYRYALYHGYDNAVQLDGDGQHDASFLEEMLDELQTSGCDMVIGSRFIKKEGFQSSTLRRAGISYFTALIKLLTGKKITDPTSGLRLVNHSLIEKFTFDYPRDYPEPESVVSIICENYKVREVPVIMRARTAGESSISLRKGIYYMIKVSLAIVIARLKK